MTQSLPPSWHPEASQPPAPPMAPPYQGYAGPPPQPPRRSGVPWWGWILIAVGVLVVISAVVSKSSTTSSSTNSAPIIYSVTSDSDPGQAMITYDTGTGTQQSEQLLPWSATVSGLRIASIVAQAGDGTFSVTCTVTQGGKVLSTNSSSGAGSVVTCTN